jgi:hypothetical protein
LALGISTCLSVREGRKFGLTVGLAFLAAGGLSWWRGHESTAYLFWIVATLLLLSAVLVPSRLGPLQRSWMQLASLISRVTTPVFMGIVYFVVVTPTGMLMRALGQNQLISGRKRDFLWVSRDETRRSDLRRQF